MKINSTIKIKVNHKKTNISISCLCMFVLCMFLNSDPYLGIADYYIFLMLYIGLTCITQDKFFRNKYALWIYIMLMWLVVVSVHSLFLGGISVGYLLSYLLYIITLLMINSIDYSKEEILLFIKCYILSAIIICLFIIIVRYDFYGGGGVRLTIKIMSNQPIDPNFVAAYLVVPFIITFGSLFHDFRWKKLCGLMILAAGLLSTSSRGAMISTFIGSLIMLIIYFKKNRKVRNSLVILLVFCIGVYVILSILPTSSLSRLFEFGSYNDSSNAKRLRDWTSGLQAFYQRPLFGYGLRGELSIISVATGSNLIAHNTYLGLLLQFGITGMSLFGCYIFHLFRRCRKNSILVGSLIATLIVVFFISAEVASFLWIPLILVSLVSKFEIEKNIPIL